MPSDLRVVVPNRPGTVLQLLRAVADAGVNVEALCGDIRPGENWGYVHLLVEDPAAARRGIETTGFEITSEHEVDLVEVEDRPGAIAEVAQRYADADRNMEVLYMAPDGRVVIGTEDMQKERFGVRMQDARY